MLIFSFDFNEFFFHLLYLVFIIYYSVVDGKCCTFIALVIFLA